MRSRATGVLLVGGASSRFGSPKALATIRNRALAELVWDVLGEACQERIAVGKRSDGLPLPFPIVDDGSAVRHPAAGIVAALRAASHEVAVVVPVDCVALSAASVRALAEAAADAAVPAFDRPLPGAYRKSALTAVENVLRARAPLAAALRRLDVATVALDPRELADADTPAELAELERRLGALTDS